MQTWIGVSLTYVHVCQTNTQFSKLPGIECLPDDNQNDEQQIASAQHSVTTKHFMIIDNQQFDIYVTEDQPKATSFDEKIATTQWIG